MATSNLKNILSSTADILSSVVKKTNLVKTNRVN